MANAREPRYGGSKGLNPRQATTSAFVLTRQVGIRGGSKQRPRTRNQDDCSKLQLCPAMEPAYTRLYETYMTPTV
eukprot:791096-Amphidinium_carterae.1